MIDATRILDMLVGGNGPQGGAPGPYGQAQPGQQQAQPQGGAGDLLERAKGMLGGVAGNLPSGLGGGLAGGVAAGAITSLLLGSKGGREFAGEALKLGAAAALGGLAYRAYSNYKSGQPVGADTSSPSVPSVKPSPLPAATPANDHALLLVRAMIAAALSDGTLDQVAAWHTAAAAIMEQAHQDLTALDNPPGVNDGVYTTFYGRLNRLARIAEQSAAAATAGDSTRLAELDADYSDLRQTMSSGPAGSGLEECLASLPS